jgi:two-component system cell cycle sensor histidine kinase/response regulator CckA
VGSESHDATARYEAAVERGGFGIWEVGDDRRTRYANPAMCSMLEVGGAEELALRDPSEFFAGTDPTRGRARQPVYVELRGARGSSRYVTGVVSRATSGDASVWAFADITELRLAQERDQQAHRLEAIGRFAGGIAHDFNNLLTVVFTCGALLQRRLREGDPLRPYVDQIDAAAKRGADLTRQVLSFARDRSSVPRVIDLNEILGTMATLLGRLVGDDVEVRTNLDPSLWRIRADRSQIEQIVMNLSLNARDAMPHGGKLVVSTTNVALDEAQASALALQPGDHVLLAISDTGVGMDDATRTRAFEPFFTTKGGKGTGLGLATVFGIVRQSGGAVAIESTMARGATIRVWLPATTSPSEALVEPPASTARARASGPGETVLLVDDDDAVREPLAEFLRLYSFTVLEARTGLDAIEHAQRFQGDIHVLVTDVVMPRMGGKVLSESLVALRPAIKILYLTGHGESTIHRRGQLPAGASVLQKPFPPEVLVSRIHDLVKDA